MTLKAMLTLGLAGVLFAIPASAQAQEEDVLIERQGSFPVPPRPPLPPPLPREPMMVSLPPPAYGIPPHLVEKLQLPKNLAERIQDLTFEANEQLIGLEADLKRAQLSLDKLLRAANPSDNAVMQQVETVGRAEMAVRKNRIGLMLQIKQLLGPELWQKLEAEMGDARREVRILRRITPPTAEGASRPEPRK